MVHRISQNAPATLLPSHWLELCHMTTCRRGEMLLLSRGKFPDKIGAVLGKKRTVTPSGPSAVSGPTFTISFSCLLPP